jgi:hypothetical protein
VVYFGGFFPKLEFSRGFLYIYLISLVVRISAAAMAGDIIFFSLAGPVGDYTGAPTVIFQRFFSVVQWQDIRMNVYFKPKPKDFFYIFLYG